MLRRRLSKASDRGHCPTTPSWWARRRHRPSAAVPASLDGPRPGGRKSLDRATEGFELGIHAGEITSFTATPELFDIGDTVDISKVFSNTGTVPITGTAVIEVQDEAGEIVADFRHDFGDLGPDSSINSDDQWDTSGATGDSYHIIGYVLYDAKATEPSIVVVSTQVRRIYLPIVLKSRP